MAAVSIGQTGRVTTTTMGAVTVSPTTNPTGAVSTTTTTKKGAGGAVVAPSGRAIRVETKKVVESQKTRAVVERGAQVTKQEGVVAVQQTATVAKVATETAHRTTVQTAVRVQETQLAKANVTTTVQHQAVRTSDKKVEQRADIATADLATTTLAAQQESARLSPLAAPTTPFAKDGTLLKGAETFRDVASDKELEQLSGGLSRVDVVEAARAFAEIDHGIDLHVVVRAQRESDIQDAFFKETQASTVSLGSHSAPPFSNVSMALDKKLEISIELTREERAQNKAGGAPYASSDDGAITLTLGGAKALEEMSGVVAGEFGVDAFDLGDSMRTLMDSDGGGDDGGDGGGGDESGGGGEGGGGGGGEG